MVDAPAGADSKTLSREIVSAYVASVARIGSWVVVSAVVYRELGADAFALLALVRGTIGILNYTSLGLAPALIHASSRFSREWTSDAIPSDRMTESSTVLAYASPAPPDPLSVVYLHATFLAAGSLFAGCLLVAAYAWLFPLLHRVPVAIGHRAGYVVLLMGVGVLGRVGGDVSGAILQTRGRIVIDNIIVAAGEALWALIVLLMIRMPLTGPRTTLGLQFVAGMYATTGVLTMAVRAFVAHITISRPSVYRFHWRIARGLLSFGILVVLAQLADYLYAPTDFILINRLLPPVQVANYAPGVQIDAGLLLLVTGLASVLLPRTALAHAADDVGAVRRYYVCGTIASVGVLAVASAFVLALSPRIFQAWFGNSMPATRAILPLMLVNTVIGGSSAVGRSILLGTGRVKPFTIAVLIAGVTNVFVSWALVRYCGMGLIGIVLGTVVAVVGRCGVWMPWYVMRSLRNAEKSDQSISDDFTSLRIS